MVNFICMNSWEDEDSIDVNFIEFQDVGPRAGFEQFHDFDANWIFSSGLCSLNIF